MFKVNNKDLYREIFIINTTIVIHYKCLSYLAFWNLTKQLFLKILSMIRSGWQNLVKFTHFSSKEAENNKYYVGYVFWNNILKNPIKILRSPFLVMFQAFWRALKGHLGLQKSLKRHSKGTWTLKGQNRTIKDSLIKVLEEFYFIQKNIRRWNF